MSTFIFRMTLAFYAGLSVYMGSVIWMCARLNAPQFMWMGVLFIVLGLGVGLCALVPRRVR